MEAKDVTYKMIQDYVKKNYGFVVKTCAIADIKKQLGLSVRKAWNSGSAKHPVEPTPRDIDAVKAVYAFYGVMFS